jgi:hypothetical protein
MLSWLFFFQSLNDYQPFTPRLDDPFPDYDTEPVMAYANG